jgi:ornithine cyclodeaminase/alanine dehydrogenase-like protein (mu-crystallin family)
VNPFGLAVEDIALAQMVYETAHSSGLGRRLPFEG